MIKREKMSKVLCILLISGLIFTGCGNTGQESVKSTETNQEDVKTGDSTWSELVCKGSIEDENGHAVTIVDSDGNVLERGDSSCTIKVESYQK